MFLKWLLITRNVDIRRQFYKWGSLRHYSSWSPSGVYPQNVTQLARQHCPARFDATFRLGLPRCAQHHRWL